MLTSISRSQLYVLDQDAALDFYVGVLGMEVAADQDLGFMRWLTVRVRDQPQSEVLLEVPGPPGMDPATAEVARDLLTRGALGGALFLTTDDAHAEFARLEGHGVDVTDEPTDRAYGVDFGIRDPFGNAVRIGQMHEVDA